MWMHVGSAMSFTGASTSLAIKDNVALPFRETKNFLFGTWKVNTQSSDDVTSTKDVDEAGLAPLTPRDRDLLIDPLWDELLYKSDPAPEIIRNPKDLGSINKVKRSLQKEIEIDLSFFFFEVKKKK